MMCRFLFARTVRVNICACPWTLFLGIVLLSAFRLPVEGAPAPSPAIIDDCQYPDDSAAQQAWQPMRGSLPPALVDLEGRKALRLRCNFEGTDIERASWDQQIRLDLGSARGVQFKLLCRNASPVSYFSIYFQSGAGWYHGVFFPESATAWNTITLDKSSMGTEGTPAGWAHITTIRISAWRAKDANTEFYVRDLRKSGVLGGDASIALIRADSAARQSREEARSVEQFTAAVAQNLYALDIGCATLSDLDVTAAAVKPAKVVVLPYNPSLPERTADLLAEYARGGGKLLVFYILPEKLRALAGVEQPAHTPAAYPGKFSSIRFSSRSVSGAPPVVGQQSWNINLFHPIDGRGRILAEWFDDQGRATGCPAIVGSPDCIVMSHVLLADDPANKRRMLLALLGSLAPEIWQQAASAAIERVGDLGGFSSFDEAARQIGKLKPDDPAVSTTLTSAGAARQEALALASQRKFAESMDKAAAASAALQEALCKAQQALPGEFRAFWCHSAFGVRGMTWDEAIGRLAANGFTAILPNMLWGGAAFYPSKVLPVAQPIAERGDQIAQCLAACRKYGLQMHVWKVNWNLGAAAPKEFVERMRREGRLQANSNGKEERWLCPSHPENRKLEIESMLEVARDYDVDGIHFDYIRYPDADHCFCAGCKERFQQATGAVVRNWPKDVLANGALRQRWLDWRRGNITAVVEAVSRQVRALKPKVRISAAVFTNWAADRDGVGQDWKLWCEKGYVDFVCPMDYTPSTASFENMVTRQLQWANRTPCYPGIGVSASSSHFGVDRVIEEINVTRRHQTGGFIIFNYGVEESKELLPLLGLGITAKAKTE